MRKPKRQYVVQSILDDGDQNLIPLDVRNMLRAAQLKIVPHAVVLRPTPSEESGEAGQTPPLPVAFCGDEREAERIKEALNQGRVVLTPQEKVRKAEELAWDPGFRSVLRSALVADETLLATFEELVARARKEREHHLQGR